MNSPAIKNVYDKLFTEKRDYGMYWLANKLVYKNIEGHKADGENIYSTWVSKKEADFILPKLTSWDRNGNSIRRKSITVIGLGIFEFTYRYGYNNNCSLTLSFIDF